MKGLYGKFEIQSGRFDSPSYDRLRAAAIKLHETVNTYWQGDCDKATVIKAQSNLCEALSTTTEPTCKCGGTGGYNIKFGQFGEESFPCEVCSADFFKPTGAERVKVCPDCGYDLKLGLRGSYECRKCGYSGNPNWVRDLPLADGKYKDGGWTLDVAYLESISKKIEPYEDAPSLEGIELVLLAHHGLPLPGINAPEKEE